METIHKHVKIAVFLIAFLNFIYAGLFTNLFAQDDPERPSIVDHFACSDYCPGPKERHMVKVYKGVEDAEECRRLGGHPATYVGWGAFHICIADYVSTDTEITLNRDEKESISGGDIIVREIPTDNKDGRTLEAIGLINAQIDDIYHVLADFESYHEFMPNVTGVDVLERNPRNAVMNYILGLPLGKIKKYRLYMNFMNNDHAALIKWKMIEWPGIKESETINDTTGYWLLKNNPKNENQVIVLYHVYTDPGHIPWGLGWIVDFLTKRSVPNVMKKTRERVYELQKAD